MDKEVITHMGGQTTRGLWGFNVKIGNYLPQGFQGQISCTILDPKITILSESIRVIFFKKCEV